LQIKTRTGLEFIDAKEPHLSNWMRSVNSSMVKKKRNCNAYRYKGDIYYKAIRLIRKWEEILVWYGREYADEMGLPRPEDEDDDDEEEEEKEELRLEPQKIPDISMVPRTEIIEPPTVPTGFECPSSPCRKVFKFSADLVRHLDVHSGIKRFLCACGVRCSTKSSLVRHLMLHSGIKPHKCPECGKGFRVPEALRRHMAVHTREKVHECKTCGSAFASEQYLAAHMKTHSSTRYSCSKCNSEFTRRDNMKKHEKSCNGREKTDDGELICTECGETFRRAQNFSFHLKSHQESRYPCPECDYVASSSGYLKRHIAFVHKPKESEHATDLNVGI